MANRLKKLNQFIAAKGVQVFSRDSYATLRIAPVAMYGERVAAGTAQLVTDLNETDNPEPILSGTATGANGYVGYVFGFALVVNPIATNTPEELAAMATTTFIRFESAGIVRNIPVAACFNLFGGSAGTTALAAATPPGLSFYRSPNPLEWDGTNSSSKISVVNGPASTTTANQTFTVVVDGWFAPKTEAALMPMFFPECTEDDSERTFIEQLIQTARLLTAVRTGMGHKIGALKA